MNHRGCRETESRAARIPTDYGHPLLVDGFKLVAISLSFLEVWTFCAYFQGCLTAQKHQAASGFEMSSPFVPKPAEIERPEVDAASKRKLPDLAVAVKAVKRPRNDGSGKNVPRHRYNLRSPTKQPSILRSASGSERSERDQDTQQRPPGGGRASRDHGKGKEGKKTLSSNPSPNHASRGRSRSNSLPEHSLPPSPPRPESLDGVPPEPPDDEEIQLDAFDAVWLLLVRIVKLERDREQETERLEAIRPNFKRFINAVEVSKNAMEFLRKKDQRISKHTSTVQPPPLWCRSSATRNLKRS
jgi:hypothetical protein